MGKYCTEIDALHHSSFRECLRSVGLIGMDTDIDSLKQYVKNITKKYIENQVVYYPNSMKKTETFIVMAYGIFHDVIVNNSIPINELPPFTMNTLRSKKQEKLKIFGMVSKPLK